MVPTLPAWIAARVDDVGLELALRRASLQLWRLELDQRIGRLQVVAGVADSHGTLHIDAQHKFLSLWVALMALNLAQLGPVFDLNDLRELSHEHDEVELTLETVGCAVDVKTLSWLSACLNEIIYNLDFDLQLVLQHRSEQGKRDESLLVGVQAQQLLQCLLHNLKGVEGLSLPEVRRRQSKQWRVVD